MRPLAGATVRATLLGPAAETTFVATADSRGRFRFDRLATGRYGVSFASALLDSLESGGPVRLAMVLPDQATRVDLAIPSGATLRAMACPGATFAPHTGVLLGLVLNADTERPLAGAQIVVGWSTVAINSATQALTPAERVTQTTADAAGQYRLCGVPTDDWLVLQVQDESRAGAALRVSIADAVGVAVRNLSFSASGARERSVAATDASPLPPLAGTAAVSGTVRTEGDRPVAGAQVTVLYAAQQARTDAQGEYSLSGLPAGTQELEIRQIGYGLVRQPVELRNGRTARQDVRLERVAMLDSIAVVAKSRRYPEFEIHRKLATHGQFLSEADIDRARAHVNSLSDIVIGVPGWQRAVAGQGSNAHVPGCVVVVDNVREPDQPGATPPAGQLNWIHPSQIGAIELYSLLSHSAPMQYHAKCVIMIWTKR